MKVFYLNVWFDYKFKKIQELMNQQFINDNQGGQNNFELIYQKRISEVEQKVSKYCSQYDALMNLLPMGNSLSSMFLFQKDLQNISRKIESENEKINNINNGQVRIDKNSYQTAISEIKSIVLANQNEIQKIKKDELQHSVDHVMDFQQQCIEKIISYQEAITNKLADYKNQIEFQTHKQARNNYANLSKNLQQKTQKYLEPLHQQMDQLLEQIQICKLKVPLRDLRQFHDFNHQRILDEIVFLNDRLEQLFDSFNQQDPNQHYDKISLIQVFKTQIENIHFQAIANKRKCLNDLLLNPTEQFRSSHQRENMQKYVTDCFLEIEQNLREVSKRFSFFKKFINDI